MMAYDAQFVGSLASPALRLDAKTGVSDINLALCAAFQNLARDWLQLWCIERREGLNEEERKHFARLHQRILVVAQIVLETPPGDHHQLVEILNLVAFFDASQPWIVEGAFGAPIEHSRYATALTLLASMLIHELKCDHWSANTRDLI